MEEVIKTWDWLRNQAEVKKTRDWFFCRKRTTLDENSNESNHAGKVFEDKRNQGQTWKIVQATCNR